MTNVAATSIAPITEELAQKLTDLQRAAMVVANHTLSGDLAGTDFQRALHAREAKLFVEIDALGGSVVMTGEWPAMQAGRVQLWEIRVRPKTQVDA